MASSRDSRQLIRMVEAAGGLVTMSNGNHYKVLGPLGVTFIALSPSDHRSYKNAITHLRKIGIDLRRSA